MIDRCATDRQVTINYDSILERGSRMNTDDDSSVGTTQSANTVKRSNRSHIMPTRRSMMTRGAAWNVIRERNWVQQTIADRDKRWCPTNIAKKLSPADRVGAIEPASTNVLIPTRDIFASPGHMWAFL